MRSRFKIPKSDEFEKLRAEAETIEYMNNRDSLWDDFFRKKNSKNSWISEEYVLSDAKAIEEDSMKDFMKRDEYYLSSYNKMLAEVSTFPERSPSEIKSSLLKESEVQKNLPVFLNPSNRELTTFFGQEKILNREELSPIQNQKILEELSSPNSSESEQSSFFNEVDTVMISECVEKLKKRKEERSEEAVSWLKKIPFDKLLRKLQRAITASLNPLKSVLTKPENFNPTYSDYITIINDTEKQFNYEGFLSEKDIKKLLKHGDSRCAERKEKAKCEFFNHAPKYSQRKDDYVHRITGEKAPDDRDPNDRNYVREPYFADRTLVYKENGKKVTNLINYNDPLERKLLRTQRYYKEKQKNIIKNQLGDSPIDIKNSEVFNEELTSRTKILDEKNNLLKGAGNTSLTKLSSLQHNFTLFSSLSPHEQQGKEEKVRKGLNDKRSFNEKDMDEDDQSLFGVDNNKEQDGHEKFNI